MLFPSLRPVSRPSARASLLVWSHNLVSAFPDEKNQGLPALTRDDFPAYLLAWPQTVPMARVHWARHLRPAPHNGVMAPCLRHRREVGAGVGARRKGADAALMGKGDAWIRQFLAFQTKYRELRAQFIGLRQRSLLVQCAWCQRRLGWKRTQAAVPGATSHSICPRCAADIVKTIALLTVSLTPAAY